MERDSLRLAQWSSCEKISDLLVRTLAVASGEGT